MHYSLGFYSPVGCTSSYFPTLFATTSTSHRADAEGCISNPNHCSENGEGGCCVNYYVPFCGDPQRYGAAAPAGSIKCMADVPVPMSAAPPSDLELTLVAEAFGSKCMRNGLLSSDKRHIIVYKHFVAESPLYTIYTKILFHFLSHSFIYFPSSCPTYYRHSLPRSAQLD